MAYIDSNAIACRLKGGVILKKTITLAEGEGWKMLAKCENGIIKQFVYRSN
jgi:hypothetical protein